MSRSFKPRSPPGWPSPDSAKRDKPEETGFGRERAPAFPKAEEKKQDDDYGTAETDDADTAYEPFGEDTAYEPEEPSRARNVRDLGILRQSRQGKTDSRYIDRIIHMRRNISNIHLSLTAVTALAILFKISLTELTTQVSSLTAGGTAARIFDVSIAVGFVGILFAAFQIPRHFIETLFYSNQDALRLLAMMGATESFVAARFRRRIIWDMIQATFWGAVISGGLYLLFSEILQIYVPVTRTYFLYDTAYALLTIVGFIVVTDVMIRWKIAHMFREQNIDRA